MARLGPLSHWGESGSPGSPERFTIIIVHHNHHHHHHRSVGICLKPQAFSCNRVVAYHASFRASHAYLVSGLRGNSSKGCHLYPSGARGIPSDLHSREPGRIEPTLLQGESGLIDLFSRRHGNGLWPGTIQLLSIIGSIGLWPGFKDLSAFGHGT